MERGGVTVYDAEDLILARNMLELAKESRDEDEILAARQYLAEVRRLQESPMAPATIAHAVFEPLGKAQSELDNPDIELDARQAVCDRCWLAFWSPAGDCPECAV